MRRGLLPVVAGCLLAGCGNLASDPTTHAHALASPNATASPASTGATTAQPGSSTSRIADSTKSTVAESAAPGAVGDASASASPSHLEGDAGAETAAPKDPFVLPGPITADTAPDGLRRIYGAANVREAEVPAGEGQTVHGVVVFPDDPSRRAYVYFQDEKTLTALSMVSVVDPGSRWHTPQGIRVGTSLSQLKALNGGPFEFLGFDWDYGGQVTDWLGGRLATPRGDATLRVQLAHGDVPKDVSYDKLPIGDRSFRSDHPQLPRMKVVVAGISVNFPGRDDQ